MVYDLIVLGGGPGGYLGAQRAAEAGLSVLLLEKNALGGVCLNEGCIPTKTLLHAAGLLEDCREGSVFGVTCGEPKLIHAAVLARKGRVVKRLVAGVRSALKQAGVQVVMARGTLAGKSGQGFVVEADGQTYTGARLLLATGSRPALPPINGLDEAMAQKVALTSGALLELSEIPPALTVLGAGVVGLELAAYFAAAGSRVSVVELSGRIAAGMDAELATLLQKSLEGRGIAFSLNTEVLSVSPRGALGARRDGQLVELEPGLVLLAAGRRPVTEGFGLESLGISAGRAGIPTDGVCQTPVPGVYAVGDCNGRCLLAHAAYRQAEAAVGHMLGQEDNIDEAVIPSVIYTHPEAAWAGLTAEQAELRGLHAHTVTLPMTYSGRYAAEHERGPGVCRLVFDREKRTLIGAQLLDGPASELIVICALLIQEQIPLERMKALVFPHPTVGEILREALLHLPPL